MSRLLLLALSFLLAAIAVALFVTGGITSSILGARVSAHSPWPSAAAAGIAFAVWSVLAYRARAIGNDLLRIQAYLDARSQAMVLVIALMAGATSIYFGTFSASGSDASGYLSHAEMLSRGRLTYSEPLAAIIDWPDGAETFTPLGWRSREGGEQVPTYAVGLPLLMVVPHVIGGSIAASLIGPFMFALAIYATGTIAARTAGNGLGPVAATWLATSPVALMQAMLPMSDVPVTAAWMMCWLYLFAGRGFSPASAGAACALSLLIRPVLAPLALVPALWLVTREPGFGRPSRRKPGPSAATAFATPVVIAGAIVALLQWRWFGSPLRSGYGTAEEIFSLANIAPNASLYTQWFLDTHGPWLLLAPVALVTASPIARWMLAFALLILVIYLSYAVFETWTYLRFLLPAIAVAIVAISVLIGSVLKRIPAVFSPVAIALLVLAIGGYQIAQARRHDVFRIQSQNARAVLAGRYLQARLPSNAVVISGQQSGAVRYYSGRSIVRWDSRDADAFVRAFERVMHEGYDVWFVLDDWEEGELRSRFAGTGAGALDWPAAMDAGRVPRTRAWRVRDRERYMKGDRVITDRLR